MIHVNKKIPMFVANYILRGREVCQLMTGFFYVCISNGSKPPCMPVMGILPLRCSSTGKVEPSFFATYTNKSKVMNYTNENCLNGIVTPNSNGRSATPLQSVTGTIHPLITTVLRPCASLLTGSVRVC